MLVGFKCGVALFLASTQLPKLFGFSGSHGDFWERMGHFFRGLGGTNPTSLALGVAALVLLLLGKTRPEEPSRGAVRRDRRHRRRARMFHLDERGVALLGEVPQGLPMPALPLVSRADINALLPLAMACFVLAAVETTAIGRMFAAKHGYRLDATQEFLAIGSANLAAGLGSGFPVSGGMSQSLVNETAGARTPLSGLVAALITLVVVAFFTGLLRDLPQPVLAAVVLVAVTGLDPGRRAAPHLALQPDGVRRGHGGARRRARLGTPERRAARRRRCRSCLLIRRASRPRVDRGRAAFPERRISRISTAIRRTQRDPRRARRPQRGLAPLLQRRSRARSQLTALLREQASAPAAARSSSWATSRTWISRAPEFLIGAARELPLAARDRVPAR